jgi:hypothetical protein
MIGPIRRQESNPVAGTPIFDAATLYTSGFATSTMSASKPSHTSFLNVGSFALSWNLALVLMCDRRLVSLLQM